MQRLIAAVCFAVASFAVAGLSMGTAFTLFAKAVVRERRIPFALSAPMPNRETLAAMQEAERISQDPNTKAYDSVEELFAELDGPKA